MNSKVATLALTVTIATTLTLTACEEKKKPDGTTTTAHEPAAEKGGGGDTQGGCPNAVTGDGTLTCGGQTYKTVKIGTQVWMAENLNYEAEGSTCYDNKPNNCKKYGRLYDWGTALSACPIGWHLPSDKEWQTLVDFAGGDKVAGKALKAKSGWENNGNGTDNFGFSALPGGEDGFNCEDDYGGCVSGNFNSVGNIGKWWSATIDNDFADAEAAYLFTISEESAYSNEAVTGYLFSVRCIQN